MIVKTFLLLTTISLISGCSTLGGFSLFGKKEKEVPIQIVTKPVQIEIIQPTLPRDIKLSAPTWYVVSEAKVPNPCKAVPSLSAEGVPVLNEDGTPQTITPKACSQEDRQNPKWPTGFTYLDKFFEEIKALSGGDILFVATTVKDYELMSANVQELRRYIRELGEVVVYYRDVTTKKPEENSDKKD
jgi:hypothetical protein